MYAKSAVTIANIFDAAASLFTSRNYADVTMSDIAGAANVTKGALYHHFSSKEDLYLTMMQNYLSEISAMTSAIASDKSGSCRKRMRQFTLAFLNLPAEKQELMRLVRRDVNSFSGSNRERLIRSYQQALPEQAESIIRDGIASGELVAEDARLLSWEHVAAVEVALRPYSRAVLGSAQKTADFVIKLFFDGVSA
jgi:AcrR family transcriptional regulator